MRFKEYMNEDISLSILKKSIQKAVKEDPKRLGHGHTGKTAFWVLSNGDILPWSAWKKEWKRIIDDKDAINFHSHSSASGKDDKGFSPLSGGDINSFRNGYHNQMGIISASGELHILKGGNWKKEDERWEDKIPKDMDKLEYFKELVKKRGGKLIISRWK